MANVYSVVADQTGYKNTPVSGANIPLTNLTGVYPGPLDAKIYVPFTAPYMSAKGAGVGGVFVSPCLDLSMTPDKAPAPVNLAALNQTVPASGYPSSSSSACKHSKDHGDK
jgi:hypothetical protein